MPQERIAFNFYKSYYDVYKELKGKDKIQFMDALLKKQFEGIEPVNLEGMVRFAYSSQKHSIDKQVKGWEDKMKVQLTDPTEGGTEGGCQGGTEGGSVQEKEKEKGEEKVQEKEKGELTQPNRQPKIDMNGYVILDENEG